MALQGGRDRGDSERLRMVEKGMRQLMSYLQSGIASFANTADRRARLNAVEGLVNTLTYLEETDENFHRYSLVRDLRRLITETLGPKLEKLLAEREWQDDGHAMVPPITEELLKSKEYHELVDSLLADTNVAVNRIMGAFSDASLPVEEVERRLRSLGHRAHADDDDVSSVHSSVTQNTLDSSFSFLPPFEELPGIVDDLHPARPMDVRIGAMASLEKFSSGDLLAAENWPDILLALCRSLADPEGTIADRALWFHASLFQAAGSPTAAEIYLSLVAHLSAVFNGTDVAASLRASAARGVSPRPGDSPQRRPAASAATASHGARALLARLRPLSTPASDAVVDTSDETTARLLRQVRLLNALQRALPKFWLRYPDKLMAAVVGDTMRLYVPPEGHARDGLPSLLHLTALVDPRASWLKRWLHASFSRVHVVRSAGADASGLAVHVAWLCLDRAWITETPKLRPALERSGQLPRGHSGNYDEDDDDAAGLAEVSKGLTRETGPIFAYRASQVSHAAFVHALSMVARMVLYAGGRSVFPLLLPSKPRLLREAGESIPSDLDAPFSLTVVDLLTVMAKLLQIDIRSTDGRDAVADSDELRASGLPRAPSLSPCAVAGDLLRDMAASTRACRDLLCAEPVLRALLSPICALLAPGQLAGTPVGPAPHPGLIFATADILAMLASSREGCTRLMSLNVASPSSRGGPLTAAHAIARVVRACLENAPALQLPPPCVESLVFACRQLYNTYEGLWSLRRHRIHALLASVASPDARAKRVDAPLLDEETALDHLLSFAATPHGTLCLAQTGLVESCAELMQRRYQRRMQVSPFERFGYGFIASQLACTPAGMLAVSRSGFVASALGDLWDHLESDSTLCGESSGTSNDPGRKALANLVKTVASPAGVWWHFVSRDSQAAAKPQPGVRRHAWQLSLRGIFEQLLSSSDADIPNAEQAHLFCVRLLSVMCTCLDSFLLLETSLGFQQSLLNLQAQCRLGWDDGDGGSADSQGPFIVDEASLARNYVLVATHLVGGVSERSLPLRELSDGPDPAPFPLFAAYPTPPEYSPRPQPHPSNTVAFAALNKALDAVAAGGDAAQQARDIQAALRTSLRPDQPRPPLSLLASVCVRMAQLSADPSASPAFGSGERILLPSSMQSQQNQPRQEGPLDALGIAMTLRYGRALGVLSGEYGSDGRKAGSRDAPSDLAAVLRHARVLSQRGQGDHRDETGFDWFAATAFLLFGGGASGVEAAEEFLGHTSRTITGLYLWHMRWPGAPLEGAAGGSVASSLWRYAHHAHHALAHAVEWLLHLELPLVLGAFRLSGIAPSQIVLHWLRQCFWNHLDWPEIVCYVACSLALGPDFPAYFCVTALSHMQQQILEHAQAHDLMTFVREEPLRGFRLADYMPFIDQLREKHRRRVLDVVMSYDGTGVGDD